MTLNTGLGKVCVVDCGQTFGHFFWFLMSSFCLALAKLRSFVQDKCFIAAQFWSMRVKFRLKIKSFAAQPIKIEPFEHFFDDNKLLLAVELSSKVE